MSADPDYDFPRDFRGYGEEGLVGLKWPNNAKIAVSFVINYEEVGSEFMSKVQLPTSGIFRAANILSRMAMTSQNQSFASSLAQVA